MKREEKLVLIRSILQSIAVIIILFISGLTVVYFLQDIKEDKVYTRLGVSGDFIGGILGTIVATIALIYIKRTYDLQKTELEKTSKQLNLQQTYIVKQQFESTFFKMLDMIHTLGKDFQNPNDKIDSFKDFIDEMKPYYHLSNGHSPIYFIPSLTPIPINENIVKSLVEDSSDNPYTVDMNLNEWIEENIMNEKRYIGYLYREIFYKSDSRLGNFFRYIHNTMYFVLKERNYYDDKDFYINLIQAQLTNSQLVVLFYNCISPVSVNKDGEYKFHEDLDKYQLLKNVPPNLLLNPTHIQFYPNTKFKFK